MALFYVYDLYRQHPLSGLNQIDKWHYFMYITCIDNVTVGLNQIDKWHYLMYIPASL